jgi:hypothetical protein
VTGVQTCALPIYAESDERLTLETSLPRGGHAARSGLPSQSAAGCDVRLSIDPSPDGKRSYAVVVADFSISDKRTHA